MSTPAIRAISWLLPLSLALLVARVLADDHHAPVAADHLALVAHLLDARLDLHDLSLLVPIGDPASAEVVGRQLNLDAVSRQDAGVVHAHLPGDVGQYLVAVLQLDPEHGVRERLDDRPLEDDRVFLGLGQWGPPKILARWAANAAGLRVGAKTQHKASGRAYSSTGIEPTPPLWRQVLRKTVALDDSTLGSLMSTITRMTDGTTARNAASLGVPLVGKPVVSTAIAASGANAWSAEARPSVRHRTSARRSPLGPTWKPPATRNHHSRPSAARATRSAATGAPRRGLRSATRSVNPASPSSRAACLPACSAGTRAMSLSASTRARAAATYSGSVS